MTNIDKLSFIQTEVARAFENIEVLISYENTLVSARETLRSAIDVGNKEVERSTQILIMKIEKDIFEIVDNTPFVKFKKKVKYKVM